MFSKTNLRAADCRSGHWQVEFFIKKGRPNLTEETKKPQLHFCMKMITKNEGLFLVKKKMIVEKTDLLLKYNEMN